MAVFAQGVVHMSLLNNCAPVAMISGGQITTRDVDCWLHFDSQRRKPDPNYNTNSRDPKLNTKQ